MYLIDGLLKPVRTRLAQTRSVLELVQLVLDPHILQAVELSSQRLNVRNKLKLLLVRLKDTGDEMSRLSLMRSGGLNVLAVELVKQVYRLEELLPSTQKDKVTVECARSLHHINSVLRVFDQATFLTVDVQQYVSRQRNIFAVLLKLIKLLSELSWGREARTRWGVELSRMSLVVEVLLSALRVLLNLTHHNAEAAGHVHALEGMQLLVNAFSQAWGVMETHKLQSSTQKKNEFDSCLLLLSVMVNSIELSEENRDVLAAWSYDDGAMSAQAGCDLFAQFFVSTIESYKHLIDRSEALDTSGAFSGEDSDDWSPEDVILGGCTSLLLGYLMRGSAANSTAVLKAMPDGSPRLLLRALAVFAAFHSQIGALTPEVAKSVLLIEKVLKASGGGDSNESDLVETMASKDSVESQRSGVSTPSLRTRAMKNLCSNLDDSDEGEGLHGQTQEEVAMLKRVATLDSRNSLEIGMRTPTRFPPRTPGRKRARAKSPVETPVSEAISKSQRTRRSSPIAVLPDGSLSSPVVARLLKRTRQLVEEFDAEFGQASRSSPTKMRRDMSDRGTVASERSPSPCMVFTLDVTCRDHGSDILDLSQDTEKEKDIYNDTATGKEVQTARPSKRKMKPVRDPDTNVIGAIAPFDFFVSSTPSTPLRVKKGTVLLQTPTKATRSPDVYRQSPSLNLTPTKSSPSTPMRLKKASGLLRTPTRNGLKDSPASAGQLKRKSKAVRPRSTCSSSSFDFKG
ncbi:hypothetical protein F441_11519 [Phytophthora nicotianae CJ01A1]|uniref:Wings apart-like protein C-terminal domain-containing protein n=1 Tax=Phytophthora nicotianae CJ01A1 TaxID=1317063 RepID=W2WUJ8_PHYNI|nr:hypothetical protein F441_11519 [Phytophthora nicotianae CJ01A1]